MCSRDNQSCFLTHKLPSYLYFNEMVQMLQNHLENFKPNCHQSMYCGPSCRCQYLCPCTPVSFSPIFSNFVITSGYDNLSYNAFSCVTTSPIFFNHVTTFSISGGQSDIFTFVVPSITFDITSYNLFCHISCYHSSWDTSEQ